MRLFVAVPFPTGVRRGLLTAVEGLRAQSQAYQRQSRRALPRPSFTQADNLHMTLAFIGETEREADARAALEEAALPPVFSLTIDGKLGRFGDLYWVGTEDCPALGELADAVRSSLLKHGFHIDTKPFRPHITLARRLELPAPPQITVPRMTMTVSRAALMLSDRPNGRLRYTELSSVCLPDA